MISVLFLDDMLWRHDKFNEALAYMPDVYVTTAFGAAAAIELLQSQEFDQVFLDHDLTGDLAHPENNGMTVVNHIMTMEKPPPYVVVHSVNYVAAQCMESTLKAHQAAIDVRRIPFPELLDRLTTNL